MGIIFIILDGEDGKSAFEFTTQTSLWRCRSVVDGWISQFIIGVRIVIFKIVPEMSWAPEGMQFTAVRRLVRD
jgi:hypothetical protein